MTKYILSIIWGHINIKNYANGKNTRNLTISSAGKQHKISLKKNNLFPMTEIVTTNNFFMTKPRAQSNLNKHQRKETPWRFTLGTNNYYNIGKSANVIKLTERQKSHRVKSIF